ncbi:MAG: RNA polymerase sigma-70 factor [Bacteroidales bacterium 36-12]|nr:MAG: RNA polymerase sigma-70 factor [Bacteroidales bacterium 36-12]
MDISTIYSTYYSRLVKFAKEFVVCQEDAENITQDVFLGIIEKNNMLSCVENFNAYIYRSVKNKCIDFLKNKVVQQKYISDMQLDVYLDNALSYNEYEYHIESEESVEKNLFIAIDKLPTKCKEIFLLSRYEGLKYREISERLGLSINTVDVQICIALKKLRKQLKYYLCA